MLHASEWAEYMHVRAISRVAPIGCEDKVLRIIDADNGTVLHKVQHGDGVCSVDFHPAGNFIVTGQSQYTPTATNVHLYPKTCQRHTCIHTQRPHACLPTCPHACLHTCPHVDPNSTHTCICHIYPQVHTVYAQDHGAFIDYMMQQRAWLDRLSHQPPYLPHTPRTYLHTCLRTCRHKCVCTHVYACQHALLYYPGCSNGMLSIVNATTGRIEREVDHGSWVRDCRFGGGGRHIATVGDKLRSASTHMSMHMPTHMS